MSVLLTPATLPSLSQPTLRASCGTPYDQLTEGEKTQSWFTDGSPQQAAARTRAWDIPEGSGEKTSSPWGEVKVVHLFIHFDGEEKRPAVCLSVSS